MVRKAHRRIEYFDIENKENAEPIQSTQELLNTLLDGKKKSPLCPLNEKDNTKEVKKPRSRKSKNEKELLETLVKSKNKKKVNKKLDYRLL